MAPKPPLSPANFFSHGSTMMLGKESASATYRKKCGDEALANSIEHIVIMVLIPHMPVTLPFLLLKATTGRTLGRLSLPIEVNSGYTIERWVHGMEASYNDIHN
jgi:hypothetical protein